MAKTNLFETTSGGFIEHDHNHDGIDRRGFLKCMAWAGTGALCVIQGGVLKSFALGSQMGSDMKSHKMAGLSFVQISDSHMGFNKPANPDVVSTLKAAVDKINALPNSPEFILHTGDISHLSNPEEFDTVDQILKATNKEIFFVPGEHDVLNDDGKMFRERCRGLGSIVKLAASASARSSSPSMLRSSSRSGFSAGAGWRFQSRRLKRRVTSAGARTRSPRLLQ